MIFVTRFHSRLDKMWAGPIPLRIKVQVNTSGEPSANIQHFNFTQIDKSGIDLEECVAAVKEITNKHTHLMLTGLMTIGEQAQSERDFSVSL